jgi:hypothetical protein
MISRLVGLAPLEVFFILLLLDRVAVAWLLGNREVRPSDLAIGTE